MQGLIFLDTETTGIHPFNDRLFQVAYSHNGKMFSQHFKPSVPISIKAQSITHVTNQMIADKKPFSGSKMQKDLQKLLKENVLVAHNAEFDVGVLGREGVETPKFICTVKVARFLDQEEQIPEYNLQFLRYYFELNLAATAHDAEGDVLVLEGVFQKLYDQLFSQMGDHQSVIDKMVEVSNQPFLFRTFRFGKHRGKKIQEVIVVDRGYVEWLLSKKMENEYEEADWIFTLKHYLNTK